MNIIAYINNSTQCCYVCGNYSKSVNYCKLQ